MKFYTAVTAERGIRERRYAILLILLVISCGNFFAINQLLGIQDQSGNNIVGIRDLLLMSVLLLGVTQLRRVPRKEGLNPLKVCCLVFVAGIVPCGIVVALSGNAPLKTIAVELVALSAWGIPIVISVRDERTLGFIQKGVMWAGIAMAFGVLVEFLTRMNIRVVTNASMGAVHNRPFPVSWVQLSLALSYVTVPILTAPRIFRRRVMLYGIAVCVVLAAVLLTQSRTYLVGYAVSIAVFAGVSALVKGGPVRASGLVFLGAGFAASFVGAMSLGGAFGGDNFAAYFHDRYSVLFDVGAAEQHAEREARIKEAEYAVDMLDSAPVFGGGLAVVYRQSIYGIAFSQTTGNMVVDDGTLAHNIVVYFATRFGLAGTIFLAVFHIVVIVSLVRAVGDRSHLGGVGQALTVGLLNVLICAWFGNGFAMPYMSPVSMTAVALVVWYETQRGLQETLRHRDRMPVRLNRETTQPQRASLSQLARQ
ncbi:MAG: hypothetical protein ABSE35_02755 [Bryobacteraceae bacterium]|jgi:O-antigen ligase